MASVTLAESAKLAQNELAAGVIENVVSVNPLYELLPFDGIDGNALQYTRENALGDSDVYGVDDTIAAKAAATFTSVTASLTSIIGDAEINGLIAATRSGDGNDQEAVQIASKAKSVGRKYQDMMVNGTGSSNQFTGILGLVSGSQQIYQSITDGGATTNGGPLSFVKLDELIDLVTDKDGQVDFLMMSARTIRSMRALLRALGGASIMETLELPSGARVMQYNGIPIFRNDWIPTNQTRGTSSGNCTSVIAGTFDDGSRTHGIAGLTASKAAGIQVQPVGPSETKDNDIIRVKWYCGLALFNANGLAVLSGVTN